MTTTAVRGEPTAADRALAELLSRSEDRPALAEAIAYRMASERAAGYELGLEDGRRMMAQDLRDVLDEAAR